MNGLAAVVGTVSDSGPSGISFVRLRVRDNDLSFYLNRANNLFDISDANAAWYVATTSNSWVNWYSTMTLASDTRFRVEAEAVDVAGNTSVNYATSAFVLDQNIPVSSVTFPLNGSFVNAISTAVNPISGSYFDTGSVANKGSDQFVKIAIRELSGVNAGKWWNGSLWLFR